MKTERIYYSSTADELIRESLLACAVKAEKQFYPGAVTVESLFRDMVGFVYGHGVWHDFPVEATNRDEIEFRKRCIQYATETDQKQHFCPETDPTSIAYRYYHLISGSNHPTN